MTELDDAPARWTKALALFAGVLFLHAAILVLGTPPPEPREVAGGADAIACPATWEESECDDLPISALDHPRPDGFHARETLCSAAKNLIHYLDLRPGTMSSACWNMATPCTDDELVAIMNGTKSQHAIRVRAAFVSAVSLKLE